MSSRATYLKNYSLQNIQEWITSLLWKPCYWGDHLKWQAQWIWHKYDYLYTVILLVKNNKFRKEISHFLLSPHYQHNIFYCWIISSFHRESVVLPVFRCYLCGCWSCWELWWQLMLYWLRESLALAHTTAPTWAAVSCCVSWSYTCSGSRCFWSIPPNTPELLRVVTPVSVTLAQGITVTGPHHYTHRSCCELRRQLVFHSLSESLLLIRTATPTGTDHLAPQP